MDWIEEIKKKLKRKNKILFSKDSEYLQDLVWLINQQNRQVLVLWALDFAEEIVKKLEIKYPNENRPRNALEATKLWASGKIKIPIAKREILSCHAFAKEISNQEDIALCHAVGQACSVVHTSGHAIGLPIYELTSIVYKLGVENCADSVEKRKQEYIERLIYWKDNYQNYTGEWASFLIK